MWQSIFDRLTLVETDSNFSYRICSELANYLQAPQLNLWLFRQEDEKIEWIADACATVLSAPLVVAVQRESVIDQAIHRMQPVSTPLAALPKEIPQTLHQACDVITWVPWVAQGRVFALLSVHAKAAEWQIEQQEGLQSIMLNLATAAFKHLGTCVPHQNHCQQLWRGIGCSPGLALGVGYCLKPSIDLSLVPIEASDDYQHELSLLTSAVEQVKQDMNSLSGVLAGRVSKDNADILSAYCQMMDRHGLMRDIAECMQQASIKATSALKLVVQRTVQQFEAMSDPYLRARAMDIRDIGERILHYLQSKAQQEVSFPENTILIADELSLFSLAQVPAEALLGICAVQGSKFSHVSILARAMGLPAVMGLTQVPIQQAHQQPVFINGYTGQIQIQLSNTQMAVARKALSADERWHDEMAKLRKAPAQTLDGYAVSLWVNVGLSGDLQHTLTKVVDGVGLFRSEVAFMRYERFPGIEKQQAIYQKILQFMSPKPVVIRTMDVGGDKQLPYFKTKEDNPYLGWRGIRMSLDHPDLFRAQLYALVAASEGLNNLHIMVPMVSNVQELRTARRYLEIAVALCQQKGLCVKMPAFGAMIEVPAATMQIHAFSGLVDFFSVGSNDLVQYMLAVDRNNTRVAHLFDSFHPAVLRVLQRVVDDAHACKKHISICGELAGDPMGAILLVAMGYDTLSMRATGLDEIKWVLRKFSLAACQQLLNKAILCHDAAAVVALIKHAFDSQGLGALAGIVDESKG